MNDDEMIPEGPQEEKLYRCPDDHGTWTEEEAKTSLMKCPVCGAELELVTKETKEDEGEEDWEDGDDDKDDLDLEEDED